MIYPWGDQRRYNAYSRYFRQKFGQRVQKVTIDAGFTCPNRDGTLGTGGCHFCNNDGFNPSYCHPEKSITRQIEEGIGFHQWRYKKAVSYLAYFQAYSNTYGDLERLKKLYAEALAHPAVIGLVVGTRPDCISPDILDHLQVLSQNHHIHVEFGIESVYDQTLIQVNRGHDFATAIKALQATRDRGITTGAHFILGLPGETREMMLESASIISSLPLDTVKFHQLQILRNTKFEEDFRKNPETFRLFELDEYITLMADFLEILNPQIVVERFAGEVPPRYQVTPGFGMVRNEQIPVLIEKELESRDSWQGKRYTDQ
jgi:uncharacterized protein